MISQLQFYRVPFIEEQNKLIDDIESFLERNSADAVESEYAIKKTTIDKFQFIKHALNLEIKITASNLYSPIFASNYVSIQNRKEGDFWPRERSSIYYYFIKSVLVTAEGTLKLTLRMDVLNTFGTQILDSNNWLDGTLTSREHRDRYYQHDGQIPAGKYPIKVDKISEGLNFPLIRKIKSTIIDSPLSGKFYLVYRSAFVYGQTEEDQSANAIKCFLVAEKGRHIPIYNYAGNARSITWTEDLDTLLPNVGDIIVFDTIDNPDAWYEKSHLVDGTRYYNGTNLKYAREKNLKGFIGVYRASSTAYRIFTILFSGTEVYSSFTQTFAGGAYSGKSHVDDSSTSSVYSAVHRRSESKSNETTFNKIRIGYKTSLGSNPSSTIPTDLQSWGNWLLAKSGWTKQTYAEGIGIQEMMTIDQVNRTDARLIEIIELPYAPNTPVANGSGANLHYTFGSNWSTSEDYDEENLDMVNAFQLVGDIEPDFSHILSTKFSVRGVQSIGATALVTSFYYGRETKLFHSDFFKYALCYDNFQTEIKLENLFGHWNFWYDAQIAPQSDLIDFDIEVTASSNLKSGLLFRLDYVYDGDLIVEDGYYESEETYPLTLLCVRNNELNLYNASYLNYIRSGYNYDVKAKNLTLKASEIGIAQNFFNQVVGAAKQGATGSATGVVNAGISLFAAYKNQEFSYQLLANQGAQLQNNINRQLAEKALQGTSVSGADNLSLFNKYNGNKLLKLEYGLQDVYKNKIARYFHYFGYATDIYKIPNLTGRLFFNYVKCVPMFKEDLVKNAYTTALPKQPPRTHDSTSAELVNDVRKRFADGVFIIHKVTNTKVIAEGSTWNVSMDKENWENFIVEDWPE